MSSSVAGKFLITYLYETFFYQKADVDDQRVMGIKLLVGGDWNMFYFPIQLGIIIIPTDEVIFFRWVGSNHQPV